MLVIMLKHKNLDDTKANTRAFSLSLISHSISATIRITFASKDRNNAPLRKFRKIFAKNLVSL